jgi:hypothetical protein
VYECLAVAAHMFCIKLIVWLLSLCLRSIPVSDMAIVGRPSERGVWGRYFFAPQYATPMWHVVCHVVGEQQPAVLAKQRSKQYTQLYCKAGFSCRAWLG